MVDTGKLLAGGTLAVAIGTGFIMWRQTRRGPTLVIAAANSSPQSKAQADYVCDGTDDQAEIQAAINAPPARKEIVLSEGTFNIVATFQFVSNMILAGQGRATILKMVAGGIPADYLFTIFEKNNIIIRDLKCDGDGVAFAPFNIFTSDRALEASHDILFENCEFKHGYDRGAGLAWSDNPTRRNYKITFRNCDFGPRKDMAGDPVDPILDIDQNTDVLIQGCRFTGDVTHTGYPLLIFWSDLAAGNPPVERVIVEDCIFENSGRECLWFTGVNDLKVRRNTFYNSVGAALAGMDVDCLNFDISDNLIRECGPTIAGCVSLGEPGLNFTGRFRNNTIVSPKAGGLMVSGIGKIEVIDNVFHDINPDGKAWNAGGFVIQAGVRDPGSFIFRGNVMHSTHDNTTPVLLYAMGGTPTAKLYFYDNLFNMPAAPLFRGLEHPTLGNVSNSELWEVLKDFSSDYRCENNKWIRQ